MVREILQKEEKREEQLPEKNTGRPSSETP
jgi:hypothetical protein